jgi:DNA-binding CsgD family transcriptional regulator
MGSCILRLDNTYFTKKEFEILYLLSLGMPNEEIAQKLFISRSTLRGYLNDLYKKISAESRSKAIVYAIEHKGEIVRQRDVEFEKNRPCTSTIKAESYTNMQGIQTQSGGTGTIVAYFDQSDWLCYKNIDFGMGVSQFSASMAVNPSSAGKQFELRLDSTTGTLIGILTVNNTGGWNTFTTQNCSISGASGVHDLFIVGKGITAGDWIGNIDWFTFSSTVPTIQAENYKISQGVYTHSAGTGTVVGNMDGGDWMCYNNIDFGEGKNQFSASVGAEPAYAGKQLELRLDSKAGTIIGTFTFNSTGGWDNFTTQTCRVSGASGIHDLYIVAKGSGRGYGNIDWFKFV